jgi:hypothetical protein
MAKARAADGLRNSSALSRQALKLLERENARRVARLDGSEPDLGPVRRRKPLK